MKKFLLVLLCLVIVLPCFTACNGDANIPGEKISDYTIILSKDAGAEEKQQSRVLVNYITNHTGVTPTVKTDEEVAASDKSKEILIGKTNRTESTKALEAVGENGFAVKFSGSKLVLAGTSDAISADAVQWFIKNYVQEKSGEKYILMDETLDVVKTYTPVKLAAASICNFSIVYSENLDDNNGKPTEPEVSYENGGIDYEVQLALDIQAALEKLTGGKVTVKSDDQPESGPEILVGKTNRSAYKKVISQVGYTQYGVGYADGSIVVAGHSTAANVMACEYFVELINDNKADMTLCLGEASTRSNAKWISAFPAYDGGIVRGTSECFGDELQYYITNTNEEQYRAYCSKLEANGYKVHMSNEVSGVLISNTYMNDKTVIHVYYAHATDETRLIVGNLSKVTYPGAGGESYKKVTDVQITQLQLDFNTNSGGMGYVITLEDGSFLLIDSGSSTNSSSSTANKDHVRIWNLLNQLNKREDGQIIIRGWFITHSHADHIAVYQKFCESYGQKVTIENYYECVVPESVGYNSKNPGSVTVKATSLHTGMKMELYGVEVEVLYTVEDMYPRTLRYFNDASSVFKITANNTTALFLGDACDKASDIISDRYGEYLKSDMVQVAHHANIGATTELYDFIDPTIAFWPTSEKLFNQLITGEGNQRFYEVNYKLYRQMRVEENYTCSDYSVTLTITEDGYVPGSAVKQVVSSVDQYK
ncbi:MAG: MBL fold metallo-hydrolase [Oscillospiraceae bacterium]|nr:MBL fold metallo-hydrolase [Oscillospiraceae bacterium]